MKNTVALAMVASKQQLAWENDIISFNENKVRSPSLIRSVDSLIIGSGLLAMKRCYSIPLKIGNILEGTADEFLDSVEDILFETFHGDVTPAVEGGKPVLYFTIEANSRDEAVKQLQNRITILAEKIPDVGILSKDIAALKHHLDYQLPV